MHEHLINTGTENSRQTDEYKIRAAKPLARHSGSENATHVVEDETQRGVLAGQCQKLLDKAEEIKDAGIYQSSAQIKGAGTRNTARRSGLGLRSKKPETTRAFTTREKIILLEGSRLNGFIFPPWTSPPSPSEFQLESGESLYQDSHELLLSTVQRASFAGWKRPSEAFPLPYLQQPALFPNCNSTMTAQGKIDLVQDVTEDCSVVASLCAITARAERGYSKMISSIINPYDHQLSKPELSPNGKYILRMHFNGCYRKVTIDDRLPTSRNEQTLHVIDRNNPGLLWPALIEKAYLKVRGGYDFPGSNSGTDIWVLTGWIPEQIFLQRNDTSLDGLWRRIFGAFKYGDLLITIGTGGLNQMEEIDIGLIGDHDYAIIDMREIEDRRLLLVKNPWAGGTTWKGPVWHSEEIDRVLSSQNAGDLESELGAGTFWMDLHDVRSNFESMYLNWNPDLFSFKEDVHFTWDVPAPTRPCGSFGCNPQFEVRSEKGGTIWLLLSRHFQDVKTLAQCQTEDHPLKSESQHGFICLYAFDNNGEKVFLSDGACFRGVYVDSPNTLIRFELLPAKGYTIVVSEQSLPQSKYSFTLSALSVHSLSITSARDRYNHWVLRQSAWTASSSGGNANSATYHLNPQFSINIPVASDIALLLEASNEDFPVHVKLLWGNGILRSSLRGRDIVGDSGEYRKGFAVADTRKVQPGTYTIICSTFDPGQLGSFSLRIGATSNCSVEKIPKPDAGLLSSLVPTAVFPPGGHRLVAPLVAQRIARLSLEVPWYPRLPNSTRGSALLLKLAIEHGQGPDKQVLLVSGQDEYLNCEVGIRTNKIDIHPGMSSHRGLWLVLERLELLGLPTKEKVDIEIHSDAPIEVGAWRQIDE